MKQPFLMGPATIAEAWYATGGITWPGETATNSMRHLDSNGACHLHSGRLQSAAQPRSTSLKPSPRQTFIVTEGSSTIVTVCQEEAAVPRQLALWAIGCHHHHWPPLAPTTSYQLS